MPRTRTKSAAILEILTQRAFTTADLLVNAVLEPLRHSYRGTPALFRGKYFSAQKSLDALKDDHAERRRFSAILSNLKRDGLIVKLKSDDKNRWGLTKKGRNEYQRLRAMERGPYPKVASPEVLVVSYDIPEKLSKHRNWLRAVLKRMEFEPLHQSTWIGKTKIPEELLSDLRERKIVNYVHVFSIGKEGSLSKLT